MTKIHSFTKVLNEILDEQFPHTVRTVVVGGDFVEDIVIELRENDKRLRYSPYELFIKSDKYEDNIEDLVNRWMSILYK